MLQGDFFIMKFKAVIYNNESQNPGWMLFENPERIIIANSADMVISKLAEVDELSQNGYYIVGYLSYEASPAFDAALKVAQAKYPVMMFGVYKEYRNIILPDPSGCLLAELSPDIKIDDYIKNIAEIKEYIASGDTYQVNFTYKLRGDFHGDALTLFLALYNAQPSPYSAFLESDDFAILSVSPELFFRKTGRSIYCSPMKGTAPRANTVDDDVAMSVWLQKSEKNRAENLMITDMVRNDLGKIADIGTVNTELFKVVRFPSVWQMISNVNALTDATLVDIFAALFPSASITGAPKVHTMEIIKELESKPREIYTGTIGIVKPGGDAEFNVAIRTALIDLKTNKIEYGVGGGITWDSSADDEYAETIHKALVITRQNKNFALFETMLWEKEKGKFLLDYHMKRLLNSADYFDFVFDLESLQKSLTELVINDEQAVVRVELCKNGDYKIEVKKVPENKNGYWRVAISKLRIDSKNRMLYHKTTERDIYKTAIQEYPGYDDVILVNENNEVTESTIANIVIEKKGMLVTPPVKCGLLNGTFRQYLLDNGEIIEEVITVDDIKTADKVFLINSVRKWIPIKIMPAD